MNASASEPNGFEPIRVTHAPTRSRGASGSAPADATEDELRWVDEYNEAVASRVSPLDPNVEVPW